MIVEQTITLNEKQISEILIKALGLGDYAKASFSHYSGDQRDPAYITVSIKSKTELIVNTTTIPN